MQRGSLNLLAGLYSGTDRYQKAYDHFKQAQKIDIKLIDQILSFTSEEQKLKFLSMRKVSMDIFFNLINQNKTEIAPGKKEALDIWLKRKGVILEAQKKFQEAIVYSDDPEAINTFHALAQARSRFSKLTFSGPGKEGLEKHRQKKSEIEKNINELEAKLSRISHTFALKQKISKANSEKVANALPVNTALIEFARIKTFNFKAKRKEKKWNQDIYLAFLLHSGKGGKPELIDLGDADHIDVLISSLKKKITDIQGTGPEKVSKKLYDLVFAPLKNGLGNITEIFISPDGNLNLIPFEVLQDPDGKYLIENYLFNYLTAGRDAMAFGQIKEKSGKALFIGDPDFDLTSGDKDSILRDMGINNSEQRILAKRSTDLRGIKFTRLPGTKKEVETIYLLFGKEKSQLYTGKNALEEVMKQKKPPSFLHIATHGFFLADTEIEDFVNDDSI